MFLTKREPVANLGPSAARMDGTFPLIARPSHAFVETAGRNVVGVDEELRRVESGRGELVDHTGDDHAAHTASPVIGIDADITNLGDSRRLGWLRSCEADDCPTVSGYDELRSLLPEAVQQDFFRSLQRCCLSLAVALRRGSRPDLSGCVEVVRVAETNFWASRSGS